MDARAGPRLGTSEAQDADLVRQIGWRRLVERKEASAARDAPRPELRQHARKMRPRLLASRETVERLPGEGGDIQRGHSLHDRRRLVELRAGQAGQAETDEHGEAEGRREARRLLENRPL